MKVFVVTYATQDQSAGDCGRDTEQREEDDVDVQKDVVFSIKLVHWLKQKSEHLSSRKTLQKIFTEL